MTTGKQKFDDIRAQHPFDIMDLAAKALVHPDVVYRMLLDEPVPREYATMVLAVLSQETGNVYTLDNVDVRLTTF